MVNYYRPVLVDNKLYIESVSGELISYKPEYKKVVVAARKKNMAMRLPNDIKNIKLASVVDIEIFNRLKVEYNER